MGQDLVLKKIIRSKCMAKKKIDKLTKDQLAALELYVQLTANKFGKSLLPIQN